MKDNKDIFNTIADQAKKVTLSEKEKAALFRTIDARVAKHKKPAPRPAAAPVPSRWMTYFGANHSSAISFALIVFIVLGAGTSFAAQGSLPGDLLYAVKVGVNEHVHSLFLSGPAKTKFEAAQAVERVKEAQTLASKGKLTDTLNAKLVADFDTHAAQVQKDVDSLTKQGELAQAVDVTTHFETALKQQDASAPTPGTIVAPPASPAETVVLAGSLAQKVQDTIETTVAARTQVENSIATSPQQTDDVKKAAEDKHVAVLALVSNLSKQLPPTAPVAAAVSMPTVTNVTSAVAVKQVAKVAKVAAPVKNPATDLVAQAKTLISSGDQAFAAGQYAEAFTFYRSASDLAAQADHILNPKVD